MAVDWLNCMQLFESVVLNSIRFEVLLYTLWFLPVSFSLHLLSRISPEKQEVSNGMTVLLHLSVAIYVTFFLHYLYFFVFFCCFWKCRLNTKLTYTKPTGPIAGTHSIILIIAPTVDSHSLCAGLRCTATLKKHGYLATQHAKHEYSYVQGEKKNILPYLTQNIMI